MIMLLIIFISAIYFISILISVYIPFWHVPFLFSMGFISGIIFIRVYDKIEGDK